MRVTLSIVLLCAACVDAPTAGAPPIARLMVTWDPFACGDPHRVAIDLDDATSGAVRATASAACDLGGLSIDAPSLGSYRVRVYAIDGGLGGTRVFDVAIEQPIVDWPIGDPP